jgi:hypothetical protein
VYNPLATPVYAKAEKPTESLQRQPSTTLADSEVSYESHRRNYHIFEFNLTKAYDETEGMADDEERYHAMLSLLAQYCLETGLAMASAMRQAMMKRIFRDEPMGLK